MEFTIKIIQDKEDGYPTDIFLYDSDRRLGTFDRPVCFNMTEIKKLFDTIKPLIDAYEKWKPQHDKFMYGELKKRPIMKVEERT